MSKLSIKETLNSDAMKEQIAKALPANCSTDRFIRIATTALLRTPDLATCSPSSFFTKLLDLAATGLDPDGRRAHLLPFNAKIKEQGKPDRWEKHVQLIIDYKGYVELAKNFGDVLAVHADVVYDGDFFEYEYGSNQKLTHRPNVKDRGEIIAVYAWMRLPKGEEQFEVLSINEINDIRSRSKSKDFGPWVTNFNEMAKKTAFRRSTKWLTLSPELSEVIEKDDDALDLARDVTPAKAPHFNQEPEPAQQPTTALPEPHAQPPDHPYPSTKELAAQPDLLA